MPLWREAQDAARALAVTLQSQAVRGPTDFERVFAAMARERPAGLLLIEDGLTIQHGKQIVDFVTQNEYRASSSPNRLWPAA